MSATLGSGRYLSYLRDHPPRHAAAEEVIAETRFRAEALGDLTIDQLAIVSPSLETLMARAPEAQNAGSAQSIEDRDLDRETGFPTPLAVPTGSNVPHYLVMEPHLPAATATVVRGFLLPLT